MQDLQTIDVNISQPGTRSEIGAICLTELGDVSEEAQEYLRIFIDNPQTEAAVALLRGTLAWQLPLSSEAPVSLPSETKPNALYLYDKRECKKHRRDRHKWKRKPTGRNLEKSKVAGEAHICLA